MIEQKNIAFDESREGIDENLLCVDVKYIKVKRILYRLAFACLEMPFFVWLLLGEASNRN